MLANTSRIRLVLTIVIVCSLMQLLTVNILVAIQHHKVEPHFERIPELKDLCYLPFHQLLGEFECEQNFTTTEQVREFSDTVMEQDKFSDAMEQQSEFGYIQTHYSDQMTAASANILSMQCWASTVSSNIKVVEPFLHMGSFFGFTLAEGSTKSQTTGDINSVRLRDVYNLKNWESQTSKRNFAPLVSWMQFQKHSPRNLIVAQNLRSALRCHGKPSRHQQTHLQRGITSL